MNIICAKTDTAEVKEQSHKGVYEYTARRFAIWSILAQSVS